MIELSKQVDHYVNRLYHIISATTPVFVEGMFADKPFVLIILGLFVGNMIFVVVGCSVQLGLPEVDDHDFLETIFLLVILVPVEAQEQVIGF